jgi:hypothetical protein
MPLVTYEQVRPYSRAIRDAVARRNMPPWFADAPAGMFANDPRLTTEEIATIKRWVDGGAPAGQRVDGDKRWTEGWRIPSPSAIFRPPQPFQIPAAGEIDYQYVIVPTGFTAGRWVSSIELRPSARSVVHHAVVFVRPPGSIWLREHKPGIPFTAKGAQLLGLSAFDEVIATYLPGSEPNVFPPDHAKWIPAGSDLIFQIHYTPNGKSAQDLPQLGMNFTGSAPTYRIYSLSMANGDFRVPPNAPNHRVTISFQVMSPALLYSLAPHMHLRGKAMRVSLIEEGEDTGTEILYVGTYNFHWQLTYRLRKPVAIARGARLLAEAVFDNSRNNPLNPDPSAAVGWGEQSREEMAVCFVDLIIPAAISPNEIFRSAFPSVR